MLDTQLTIGGAFLMAKFSPEEKINAVKEYLNGNEGYLLLSKRIEVDSSLLRNWVKQFELHGEQAFIKRYTNYSYQYKLDVLSYIKENGSSIREAAAIFNIPTPSTILAWQRDIEANGIGALKSKKKGRPSMKKKQPTNAKQVEGSIEALQAELEYLRMENAYLKKLNALVQSKEKSPNQTKQK